MSLQPRWYQSEANDAVWKYMAAKSGNPVVVLPTGAGKSLLIALLIRQALEFGGRVIVLAHRKELLQQNADEIRGLIPGVDVGIYSAGLKSREIHNAVVVAGIQSVFRKAEDLGRRHLILVDEAHLISDLEESMYGQFLAAMKANEGLRIVGLTATAFRTGTGPICGPERIFQRVVFEAKTAQLIAEGFLCPITNKVAEAEVNTDKVGLRGGEFVESEMQAAFDVDEKVQAACAEILDKTQERHSILVFASGIHHAEQIAELLPGSAVVTGETLPIERAETLRRFVAGELRFLVNVDVLSTGFNARCVDAIAILRATMSPGLFCQMVGRGLRLHESKANCIAEGQRVLTDHGLVEIQNITEAMKIWDGIEFVSHCGIVLRGEMPVISYAGLIATEDHNVWTKEGWKKTGECSIKQIPIAVTGMDRKGIKLSDGYFRDSYSCWREEQAVFNDHVQRVWEKRKEGSGHNKVKNGWMQKVWKKTQLSKALFRCSKMAADAMYIRKGKVHKPQQQLMEKLWRAWNNIRIRFSKFNGCLPDEKLFDHTGSGDRPNQQRSRLCAGEYSSCERKSKCEQQERQRRNEKNAQVQNDVSTCELRGQHFSTPTNDHDVCGGNCKIQQKVMQAKRRVWDIVNCGPRNRFTCEGLLVSNCTLLDFGGNIARHGSIDDENFGRSEGKGRAGVAAENGRGKRCPSCELDVSPSTVVCPECNFIFPRERELKHDITADETSQLTGATPPEEWEVRDVVVRVHTKKDDSEAPQTVRVDYVCNPIKSSKIDNDCKYQCGATTGTTRTNGPHVELICDGCGKHQKFVPKSSVEQAGNLATITIPEWTCPGHQGFARLKFLAWWDARSLCDPPDNATDAVALINMGVCRRPVRITTKKDGRWHRITECAFESEKPTELAQQEETKVYSGIEDDCPF